MKPLMLLVLATGVHPSASTIEEEKTRYRTLRMTLAAVVLTVLTVLALLALLLVKKH